MNLPVAVVTGATGGIGRWIALGLAKAGDHTVMVGRNAARGQAAQDWIANQASRTSTEFMLADLASLAETQALGHSLVTAYPKIDILVANAGIFSARHETTPEGHDRVLAVNLLSPFVLIGALQPALIAAAPSRIIVVGSSTSDNARIDPANLELTRRWSMIRAYSQSKLAVMMVTFEYADRLRRHGVTANVVHPGTVATGLVRTRGIIGLAWRLMAPWIRTEEQGAETPLYAALAPELAETTGQYFKNRARAEPNRLTGNRALADSVWEATRRLAKVDPT